MSDQPKCQICGLTTNLYIVSDGNQSHYACARHIGAVAEAEMAHSLAKGITVKRVQNVN